MRESTAGRLYVLCLHKQVQTDGVGRCADPADDDLRHKKVKEHRAESFDQ